jgi:hypothetical protein
MTPTEELVKRLPSDLGGLPADRIERTDHVLQPWEKRCHALTDVLDAHKIINAEEKRRGVEALGRMVGRLSYYERWAVAFANILFQKGSSLPRNWRSRWTRLPIGLPQAGSVGNEGDDITFRSAVLRGARPAARS